MEKGKKKLATLVGVNYINRKDMLLHGCINDVYEMQKVLISKFGFDQENITVLTDERNKLGSNRLAKGVHIKFAINQMINKAEEGDVLCFYFSGHGTSFPDPHNADELEEAIVPCDLNLITDHDFRHFVDLVPKGASFTILADACHSGGLVYKEKEQIGPSITPTIPNTTQRTNDTSLDKRIPIDIIVQHLNEQLKSNKGDGINDESLDIGEDGVNNESPHIGSLLSKSFGHTCSLKVLVPAYHASLSTNPSLSKVLEIGSQLLHTPNTAAATGAASVGAAGVTTEGATASAAAVNKAVVVSTADVNKATDVGNHLFAAGDDHIDVLHGASMATGFNLFKVLKESSLKLGLKKRTNSENPDAGILLSGCQSDETSKDSTTGGAFSMAFRTVVEEHVSSLKSYREAVFKIREIIREQGYMQHPCLYCDDKYVDAPFLGFNL